MDDISFIERHPMCDEIYPKLVEPQPEPEIEEGKFEEPPARCEELEPKLNEWLKWDKNGTDRTAILNLVSGREWAKLKQRLFKRLKFGTAGLRGVMQAGFDSMNDLVVIQTAQGLLKYILQCFPEEEDQKKGIVIGYDGRYHSYRFAQLTATVFVNAGIPVILFGKVVPTPLVPFTILERKCLAGVMVTASHNPKEDNGYKVYWNNGAQIINPHDTNIEQSILENLEPLESSWNIDILSSDLVQDPLEDILNIYYTKMLAQIPQEVLGECNYTSTVRFVYTAMHGVGYEYVERAFAEAKLRPLVVVMEQRDPDPSFPTVKFPNPEEGASCLELSHRLAKKTLADLILANDPDADRLACSERDPDGNWKLFSGNELGALLGWWAVECYKKTYPNQPLSDCVLMSSTVSSKVLRAIAAIEGCEYIETLTGFKWMGNKAVELIAKGKNVLFAFEEAIGFMFGTAVLDKDGVSAACHLASLTCYLLETDNMSLSDKLNEIYHTYGFHYTETSYFLCHEPKIIEAIFERIRNYDGDNTYPESIMNEKYVIASIRDLTVDVDTSEKDGRARLPVNPNNQMITFSFENGAVITLRTSGTEPKIKYYAEMCAQPDEKNWNELRSILSEMTLALVEELLSPNKNKLIYRD